MLEIELPGFTQTGVTVEGPDLVPVLTPIVTGDADLVMHERGEWSNPAAGVVILKPILDAAAALLGTTIDANKGHVDFIATRLNGGSVTIENAAAELSWYLVDGGLPMRVNDDPVPAGALVFFGFTNIDTGMVTFRAEKDSTPCRWDPLVFPGPEPGTVTVPIRAGWWTRLLEVACD
jgi:hypothetical protein